MNIAGKVPQKRKLSACHEKQPGCNTNNSKDNKCLTDPYLLPP